MKNTPISISIPHNVYKAIQKMAAKDMRSARNYMAKIIIESVPESMIEKEPEKPIVIQSNNITPIRVQDEDKLSCKTCGKEMKLSNSLYIQHNGLCKDCR